MDGSQTPAAAPPVASLASLDHAPLNGAALDALFRTARSRNAWVEETLPEALLRQVYELAALGPTSANSSPARYVFATSAQAKATLAPLLSEGNRKALAVPCIVVVGYDLDFPRHMPALFPHNPSAQHWFGPIEGPARAEAAFRNGTLSGAYLMIAARALGLDCGAMSGFDADGVTRAFFDGTHARANFLCALGHGADTPFPRSPRLAFDEAARFA